MCFWYTTFIYMIVFYIGSERKIMYIVYGFCPQQRTENSRGWNGFQHPSRGAVLRGCPQRNPAQVSEIPDAYVAQHFFQGGKAPNPKHVWRPQRGEAADDNNSYWWHNCCLVSFLGVPQTFMGVGHPKNFILLQIKLGSFHEKVTTWNYSVDFSLNSHMIGNFSYRYSDRSYTSMVITLGENVCRSLVSFDHGEGVEGKGSREREIGKEIEIEIDRVFASLGGCLLFERWDLIVSSVGMVSCLKLTHRTCCLSFNILPHFQSLS